MGTKWYSCGPGCRQLPLGLSQVDDTSAKYSTFPPQLRVLRLPGTQLNRRILRLVFVLRLSSTSTRPHRGTNSEDSIIPRQWRYFSSINGVQYSIQTSGRLLSYRRFRPRRLSKSLNVSLGLNGTRMVRIQTKYGISRISLDFAFCRYPFAAVET